MEGPRMGSSRLKSSAVVVFLLVAGVYTCAHKISEHRAVYPGQVTFIGHPLNIFGSRYTRATWRQPLPEVIPLPDVTLHVDGRAYKLSELTPELTDELSGVRVKGRLSDARGSRFSYAFEEGRLIRFSFKRLSGSEQASNNNVETVYLSIGDGEPFAMPITNRELRRRAGRPVRTYLTSGQ
jgi:hypothetical protein